MNYHRPVRRKADGSIEYRSVDQVMAEAIASEDFKKLPGHGKPLDLEGYCTADPSLRVANKLLMDNKVIPQPLQDRKEIEVQCQAAADLLVREQATLAQMRQQTQHAAQPVLAALADRHSALTLLGWDCWPKEYSEPQAAPLPALRSWLKAGAVWQRTLDGHNRRLEVVISTGLDHLKKAQEQTKRLNLQAALTRQFTPRFSLKPIDLTAWEQQARSQFQPLTALPIDLEERLRVYHRAQRPSLWTRLLS